MLLEVKKYYDANNQTLPEKIAKITKLYKSELEKLYPNIDNTLAKLWLYLNDFDESKIFCSRSGRNRRLLSFQKGLLKFCGNQSVCVCNRENFDSAVASRDEVTKEKIKKKRAKTNLKKYGHEFASQAEDIKDRAAATCLLKYGTKSPTQNPEILNKVKSTCLNNHGVEFPQQKWEILEKSNQTFMNKYGVTRPAKDPEVRQQAMKTMLEKYNVTNSMKVPEIAEKVRIANKLARYEAMLSFRTGFTPLFTGEIYAKSEKDQKLPWKCNSCSLEFGSSIYNVRCPTCNPQNESWGETVIRKFLEENNIEYHQHDRKTIVPYELDFYIPSKQLAIEFNGIYWHSEIILDDKMYHQNKFLRCKNKNIRLIQIFENDLMHKTDIVIDRLTHILGLKKNKLGARNCVLRKSTNNEVKNFFNNNHLQSNRPTNNVWVLENKGEIVAALSMAKSRFSKLAEWEILRFAVLKDYTVTGALGRLFNQAVKDLNAQTVVTYSNLNWGVGQAYKNIGFEFQNYSDPAAWYFQNLDNVYSRMKFQKHKLDNPQGLSESEWARQNGYNRFWDSGNAVWLWRKK